ncbi:hypothetical protein VTG60DRAFT_6262 [Thermothelomyces hinnuleus]
MSRQIAIRHFSHRAAHSIPPFPPAPNLCKKETFTKHKQTLLAPHNIKLPIFATPTAGGPQPNSRPMLRCPDTHPILARDERRKEAKRRLGKKKRGGREGRGGGPLFFKCINLIPTPPPFLPPNHPWMGPTLQEPPGPIRELQYRPVLTGTLDRSS